MEEGAATGAVIDPTANPEEQVKLDENGNPIPEGEVLVNITEETF